MHGKSIVGLHFTYIQIENQRRLVIEKLGYICCALESDFKIAQNIYSTKAKYLNDTKATATETASGLKKQLDTLKEIFLETGLVSRSIEKTLQRNKDGLLEIDYLEILDKDTFSAISDNTKNFIIIIAGYVEGIRLIDNIDFRIEG